MERKDLYAIRTWEAHQATQAATIATIGLEFKGLVRSTRRFAWLARLALAS